MPAAGELAEPFLPDSSQAEPLPHKQQAPDGGRYASFPPSSGATNQPPPANQGVSNLLLL